MCAVLAAHRPAEVASRKEEEPEDRTEPMLDALRATLHGVVRDAGAAVARGDADDLGRIVRSVNGCAGNCAAMVLTGRAKDIEHAARHRLRPLQITEPA